MAEPTQIAHPWRASLRTGLAVTPIALAAAGTVAEEGAKFIAEQFPGTPVAAGSVAVAAFIVGLSILVNRLMLTDKVARLLDVLGLGPAPKGENS